MKTKDVASDIELEVDKLINLLDRSIFGGQKFEREQADDFYKTLLTLQDDIRNLDLTAMAARFAKRGKTVNKLEREVRSSRKAFNRVHRQLHEAEADLEIALDLIEEKNAASARNKQKLARYERLALGLSDALFCDDDNK
jgi:uncharacterized protein YerC